MAKTYKFADFDDDRPLCGIDEAGRGPLAGPLVIAGVVLLSPIDGLDDSKKLTQARREELYDLIVSSAKYHIVSFDADEVDDLGISACLHKGLSKIKDYFGDGFGYLFDGNSSFGVSDIATLIKADMEVAEVSAASILAKVTRDREMMTLAQQYPQYGFERHKGYGTKAHIEAIVKYGRSPVHRHTFHIKEIDEPTLF